MRRLVPAAALLLAAGTAHAQGTLADYRRAEQFLAPAVDRLVAGIQVSPSWLDSTDSFWYRRDAFGGRDFWVVDAARGSREPAFDHSRLADSLARAMGRRVRPDSLPFDEFSFARGGGALEFTAADARWSCSLATYACTQSRREDEGAGTEVKSPDGRWVAYLDNHNLRLRSTQSGEVLRLTDDGERLNGYAASLPSPVQMVRSGGEDPPLRPSATWSPDSRRLVAYRLDQRSAGRFTLVQSVPPVGVRPRSFNYAYPLPGDQGLTMAVPLIFDLVSRTRVTIQTDPLQLLYYGGPAFRWSRDGTRLWHTYTERGYRSIALREVDALTGRSRVMVEERIEPYVDPHNTFYRVLGDGAEVLWASERDGHTHLYLYDGRTGRLKQQLTRGEWVVRQILGVDERARVAFFVAAGREADRDPYLRHLYRVNLDGTGLRLLTPELGDHSVSLSPTSNYFADTYSLPDQPPVSLLRRAADGSVVRELERADIGPLLATGWRPPVPFRARTADGTADAYGIMWRPTGFDSTRRYPVVEQIYTGPHGFFVPKTFAAFRNHAQTIAELGFAVVMVDGPGTNFRGRRFRLASYRNLGGPHDDHIAALRQLAARHPYLDLERVGVYGHSAGGYDAMHAMLAHPDFYRVAVASAGNHDHRMDKAWWNELWMGFPVDSHYVQQSNVTMAPRLEGRVLLAHGDLDENVHPSSTIQLVDALVRANKDFDLLILPNRNHGFGTDPYFVRRRWDYFVRYLLGVEPPRGYRIGGETAVSDAR
jgi:dipeptidyl aminopeptidase/acylaminoacyl peptidase